MYKALLVFYLAFLVFAFALPIWRFWRREATSPLVFATDASVHAYVARWFKLLIAAVLAVVAALAAGIDPSLLGLLAWLDGPAARWTGAALLAASVPLVAIAQVEMGRSWRIGIDRQRATDLVTSGVFQWTRNPIFLGIRINLLGLFVLVPTGVTFALWLLGEVLVAIQVRLEEDHLLTMAGERYEAYRRRVRRWIGRTARSASA